MTSTTRVDPQLERKTSEMLKREGIIGVNEQLETLYLGEDEIEQFMAKYLRENPGTEVETRYINHPPVELTQNIEVRWLRPETPEIPPIIIKEVEDESAQQQPTQPPLRIVQKSRALVATTSCNEEPLVIREKPPMVAIPEPKFAYVQNVVKRQPSGAANSTGGVNKTNSQSTLGQSRPGVGRSRLDFDEQRSERDTMNYSYDDQGGSIVDYDEVVDECYEEGQRSTMTRDNDEFSEHRALGVRHHQPRTYEDEHQLRLYEEKLKKTLYEEYLLRLERERLERKLSKSGLLEERIRERSISQEGMSTHHRQLLLLRGDNRGGGGGGAGGTDENEASNTNGGGANMRHHTIRERNTQSLEKDLNSNTTVTYSQTQTQTTAQTPILPPPLPQNSQHKFHLGLHSHTSSYKNIKFTRVTDETDLERLNSILNEPVAAAPTEALPLPPPLPPAPPIVVPVAAATANDLLNKSTSSNTVMIRIKPIVNPPKNTASSVSDYSDLVNEQYFAIIRPDSVCNSSFKNDQQLNRILSGGFNV